MEHEGSLPSSKESTKDANLQMMNVGHTLTPYSYPVRFILWRPRILWGAPVKISLSIRPSIRLTHKQATTWDPLNEYSLNLIHSCMHKRRATDGYVATLFVELRVSWVSLMSRTKITILPSRSFFCDKILGRRDNVTDHCTSDSQFHSLSSQSHFVHKSAIV
jgi:hypothetical protein